MSQQFFYRVKDDVFGPVTGAELREKAIEGHVNPFTLVRVDDSEWVPATRLKNLFDASGKPITHEQLMKGAVRNHPSEWFYQEAHQVVGPLSASQLKEAANEGHIKADTLVRKGDHSEWATADQVEGLVSTPPPQPTPSPPAPPPPVADETPVVAYFVEEPSDEAHENKSCPYCGEEILAVAKKCRFCGEFLVEGIRRTSSPFGPQNNPTTDVFSVLTLVTGVLSLVFLPIILVPVCLICGWISHYRLKENPQLRGEGKQSIGMLLGSLGLLYLLIQLGVWG